MAELLFPVYPDGTKMINNNIGVSTIGDKVYYFNSGGPIYSHEKSDYECFRFITSQLICLKSVRQIEIIEFFKINKRSVIRWQHLYETKGTKGFFKSKKSRRSGHVLTKELIPEVQGQLNIGKSKEEICLLYGIKNGTLNKALQQGRLTKPFIELNKKEEEMTQSERSKEDSKARMGVACTNEIGRIEAMFKKK
jgi:hypothetical protein